MRILFTSLRMSSHFMPLVPFVEACVRRGHAVAVAAPADLAERVAATGATFLPVGHPGEAGLGPLWARLPGASQEHQEAIMIGEVFAGACAGAALPGVLEAMASWRPSIVVRESQEYAAIVAAEKLGIPHAHVAILAATAEAKTAVLAASAVDAHGRGAGLSPDPAGERITSETALTLFPPSYDPVLPVLPSRPAPGRTLHFRVNRGDAPPLPDWWPGHAGPFVYLTLGTMTGQIETHRLAYRGVIDAVAELPVRALLTIGRELPLEILGVVPPHVHVERFVPQDDVLPHAAAVLCHGGSGTVIGSLAAGAPLVIAPMFADQPFNAERVAALGAGLAVSKEAPRPALRDALSRVLEERSFRDRARQLAAEIAALPSVDDADGAIERLASAR